MIIFNIGAMKVLSQFASGKVFAGHEKVLEHNRLCRGNSACGHFQLIDKNIVKALMRPTSEMSPSRSAPAGLVRRLNIGEASLLCRTIQA